MSGSRISALTPEIDSKMNSDEPSLERDFQEPSLHILLSHETATNESVFSGVSRFGARGGSGLPPKKFGNPGERLRKKKWDLSELPKFEKNFYVEHPEVARLTPVRKGCE